MTENLRLERDRLRTLVDRLLQAQEQERLSLARELHDGLLQFVIGARLLVDKARRRPDPRLLSTASERLENAVVEGRRLIGELRPPSLEDFGLGEMLSDLLDRMTTDSGVTFDLEIELDDTELPPIFKGNLFRMTQEAVQNVIRHAQTNRARVWLGHMPGELVLRVEDEGVGFEPGQVQASSANLGLASLAERAELLGGRCQVESRRGQGTAVAIHLPWPAPGFLEPFSQRGQLSPSYLSELREKALAALSDQETDEPVKELRLHKVMLEMRNTELHQAQLELEHQRDRYRNLWEYAPAGYLTVDAEARVTSANLTACGLLGLKRHELEGLSLYDLAGLEEQVQLKAFLSEGGEREIWLQRGETEKGFLALVDLRVDPTGARQVLVSDVTNLRLLLDQRADLTREVTERRLGQGRLVGAVAHILNKHLQTILGRVDQLVVTQPEGDRPSLVAEIRTAAERVTELCRKLVASAAEGLVEPRSLDLNEFLRSLLPELESMLAPARCVLNLAVGLPPVLADPAALLEVVKELVRNAADAFVSGQGQVTLTTGWNHAEGRIQLDIQDNGHGMDQAARALAFEPFFTTRQARRGLGLVEVMGLVEAHHGDLQVHSEQGFGTTVRLLLPRGE